jgi:hypothetical protein
MADTVQLEWRRSACVAPVASSHIEMRGIFEMPRFWLRLQETGATRPGSEV